MRHSALLLLLALCPTWFGACAEQSLDEPAYGFGSRADELACDGSDDLCWPSRDVIAMQVILEREQDLLLEPALAYQHQLAIFEALSKVAHKLSDQERALVATLQESAEPPEQILLALQAELLPRLKGRYYATAMVPVGELLVADSNESADQQSEFRADSLSSEHSEAVVASLERLSESGPGGKLYASMLVLSGVLAVDYRPKLSLGAPFGISREEAANEVIVRYKRASGLLGLGTGALSLIPVVGTILAIPTDAFADFALSARMTYEICAIYGWDMHQGNELFTMTMFMFSDGDFEDMSGELAESATIPNLIRAIGKRVGLTISVPLAVRISSTAIVVLVRAMAKIGQKLAIKSTATTAFKSVLGTVLGWATAGLAVVGTSIAHYFVTDRLGEHVKLLSKPWLTGLPSEGAEYLKSRTDRDCFFAALSSMAQVDGDITSSEQALFQAFLRKSYYEGQGHWYQLASDERVAHATTLASPGASTACLAEAFGDEVAIRRVSVISHLFSMLAIDRQESAEELSLYLDVEEALQETSAWNDFSLDPHMLGYVERVITLSINPATIEVPAEYQDARDSLRTEDLLPFLGETNLEVRGDFQCGFAGDC